MGGGVKDAGYEVSFTVGVATETRNALGCNETTEGGRGTGMGNPRPPAFWNVTFQKCQQKSSLTKGLEAKASSEMWSEPC